MKNKIMFVFIAFVLAFLAWKQWQVNAESRSLGPEAYGVGSSVEFGEKRSGLLGHELSHGRQQERGGKKEELFSQDLSNVPVPEKKLDLNESQDAVPAVIEYSIPYVK